MQTYIVKFIIGVIVGFLVTTFIIELKNEKSEMRNYQKRRIGRKYFFIGFLAGILAMYLSMKYIF